MSVTTHDASAGLGDREVVDAVGEHRSRASPASVSRAIVRTGNVAIAPTGIGVGARRDDPRAQVAVGHDAPPVGHGDQQRGHAFGGHEGGGIGDGRRGVRGDRLAAHELSDRREPAVGCVAGSAAEVIRRRMLPITNVMPACDPSTASAARRDQVAERVLLRANGEGGHLVGEQRELAEHLALNQQVEQLPSSSSSTAPLRTT